MNWIVSSRDSLNTVFATHLGDITQNFDTVEAEFQRASANQAILDSNGVKNAVNTGNHDFANNGSSSVAHFFDQYFPPSRYDGLPLVRRLPGRSRPTASRTGATTGRTRTTSSCSPRVGWTS